MRVDVSVVLSSARSTSPAVSRKQDEVESVQASNKGRAETDLYPLAGLVRRGGERQCMWKPLWHELRERNEERSDLPSIEKVEIGRISTHSHLTAVREDDQSLQTEQVW